MNSNATHIRTAAVHPRPTSPGGIIELPPAEKAQVWIDFDGTITRCDVLDELIQQFSVDESWKRVEQEWQAGRIGSFECLTQEFALLRITAAELDRFLDSIPIDDGAGELLQLLRQFEVPFAILSDGVDRFIRRILGRLGIADVIIRSNAVVHSGTRLRLRCPHRHPECDVAAAHCKCASAESLLQPGRTSIYIGDGRSDLCPARKAGVVFAKGTLARCLRAERNPFRTFDSLSDVAAALRASWSVDPRVLQGVLCERTTLP
ncbi:MAG: MtnX-like HAD-IB family phosphatase [Tepidisphaerales bacterium]